MKAMSGFWGSDLPAILASLDRIVIAVLADLVKLSFDDWFSKIWPLAAFLAPRRLFMPALIAALSSGPMYHFWSLFAADVHPTSILLAPSAFDLLAAGTVLGMACHRADSVQDERAFRALPVILAISTASVGFE